jgi:serine/threonine-protein kinase
MGVVYKARQLRPRRLVALKMILAGEYAGAEALHRFRVEAEAVARLSHPNIVQVFEVGEHDGRPYLTLEYIEGGSLAQRLARGPLRPRRAAALLH